MIYIIYSVNVCSGHNFLQVLCKHGADVNKASKYGSSPLRQAAYHGKVEAVKVTNP